MIAPPDATRATLPLCDIEIDDARFRLGASGPDQRLVDSIRRIGVLRPPVVLEGAPAVLPVFGHGRLRALRELAVERAEVVRVRAVDPEWYLRAALDRHYRQALGPVARLRLVRLLRREFTLDERRIEPIARAELGVPDALAGDDAAASVLSLPPELLDYLDHRAIGYKTIRELVGLDPAAIALLAGWIGATDMRVNVFKEIVEMLGDLTTRPEVLRALSVETDPSMDRRACERAIHEAVFCARYPDYAAGRERANNSLRALTVPGVEVVFPEFFEGNTVEVRIRLGRRDGASILRERIGRIDDDALARLLELL